MIRRKKLFSKENSGNLNEYQKDDKFTLLSCHLGNNYCHDVLEEVNRLYKESEIARINSEYLKSVEMLQKAFEKTKELNETSCIKCVNLFQSNIDQTLKILKEEIQQLSMGFLGKKNYELAYMRLSNLEKKISQM